MGAGTSTSATCSIAARGSRTTLPALGRDELVGARLVYDAVLWNIAVLGEAASKVPRAVHEAHTEIPWADITGTRNRIVHGYGSIREQIVWEIVSGDIPQLIPQLRALLREAEGQD